MQFDFAIFFAVVVLGYYLLPQVLRNAFLLAASYYFYIRAGKPIMVIYLLASSVIGYLAGLLLERLKKRGGKKLLLTAAILLNLSFLLVFKYEPFFAESFNKIVTAFGGAFQLQVLDGLIVPIGISFYTLQLIGYNIDVYREQQPAARNPINFALFVSFFPYILSGPIPRAGQLLPQFKEKHLFSYQTLLFGGQRFVWGLFKKVLIADWLNIIGNGIYLDVTQKSGLHVFSTALLFMIYLYLDFSAYSDMAIGLGQMLGFRFMENFDTPFFATSISEYWQRWHISLTSWLRDYIYIPLGGSRKGFLRKQCNILIIFLISGLWHGANVNFLIWGALFALVRIIEELWRRWVKPLDIRNKLVRGGLNLIQRLAVFVTVSTCFVFFRVSKFADARYIVTHYIGASDWQELGRTVLGTISGQMSAGTSNIFIYLLFGMLLFSLLLVACLEWLCIYKAPLEREDRANILRHLPALPRWLCYIFIVATLIFFGAFGSSGFVYQAF